MKLHAHFYKNGKLVHAKVVIIFCGFIMLVLYKGTVGSMACRSFAGCKSVYGVGDVHGKAGSESGEGSGYKRSG